MNQPTPAQSSFFETNLLDQLDLNDPLLLLANQINWQQFDDAFSVGKTTKSGRPRKSVRVMVGLLILKQLEDLSDENVVLQWKRNPYYQAFCGAIQFSNQLPCHSTELVKFRQRIGKDGFDKIFKMSVLLHGDDAEEKSVNIDSTVQEKNITYPTDGKLAIKIINRINKLAKKEGIQQRRTFVKEVKEKRIELRFFKHNKKKGTARKAIKRLKTIAGILIREMERQLNADILELHQEDFDTYKKVLKQKKGDKNKIYSLHEPKVYCMAKGKEHKRFEFGAKASIVTTATGGIILSAVSHEKNINDSKTLDEVLNKALEVRKKPIIEAICDRGYRGGKSEAGIKIVLPKPPLKKDNRYQRDKKRKKCQRRAAIEPIIGHLKSDFRMSRNFLKGVIGDEINLLMAACAWNLRKWMVKAMQGIFCALKTEINTLFNRLILRLQDKMVELLY